MGSRKRKQKEVQIPDPFMHVLGLYYSCTLCIPSCYACVLVCNGHLKCRLRMEHMHHNRTSKVCLGSNKIIMSGQPREEEHNTACKYKACNTELDTCGGQAGCGQCDEKLSADPILGIAQYPPKKLLPMVK